MSKDKKKKNKNKSFKEKENRVSKYSRKISSDVEELTFTQQEQFDFLGELDSLDNLDISFVEEKNKKKVVRDLGKDSKIEYKSKNNALCYLFIFLIICLSLFIIYHFISYDHKKVKVVEKEVIKTVVDDNYLFLGDSITEFYDLEKYYENLDVVNSGISGNTTSDILKDMKNRVYRYNPSKVFILIGINDPYVNIKRDDTIKNIKEIVNLIKENRPYTEIYLESIYPINNTDDEKISHDMVSDKRKNEDVIKINEELEKFSKDEKITFIDLHSKLVDSDGNLNIDYTKEGLHLSDKGYEVVTEVLQKYLKK